MAGEGKPKTHKQKFAFLVGAVAGGATEFFVNAKHIDEIDDLCEPKFLHNLPPLPRMCPDEENMGSTMGGIPGDAQPLDFSEMVAVGEWALMGGIVALVAYNGFLVFSIPRFRWQIGTRIINLCAVKSVDSVSGRRTV